MRFLLITNNEDQFRSLAINHGVKLGGLEREKPIIQAVIPQTLTEIFKEMKKKQVA